MSFWCVVHSSSLHMHKPISALLLFLAFVGFAAALPSDILANLTIGNCTFDPAIDLNDAQNPPYVAEFNCTFDCDYAFNLTASADAINGTNITYAPSQSQDSVGLDQLVFNVTAQNGNETYTYVLTADRCHGNETTLSGLEIDNCTLSPTFSPLTLSYSCQLPSPDLAPTVVVDANTTDPDATVDTTVVGRSECDNFTLEINVTSTDGESWALTTVNISFLECSNADLLNVTFVPPCAENPDGQAEPTTENGNPTTGGINANEYFECTIPPNTTSATVTPFPEDPDASTTVVGGTGLEPGVETVVVDVESEDMQVEESKTFYLLQEALSTQTDVATIIRFVPYLCEEISPRLTNTNDNGTCSARLPRWYDEWVITTIELADEDATWDLSADAIELGDNNVSLQITAADETTTRNYTLFYYRELEPNTTVQDVKVRMSGENLQTPYANCSWPFSYCEVPRECKRFCVEVTPTDPEADVTSPQRGLCPDWFHIKVNQTIEFDFNVTAYYDLDNSSAGFLTQLYEFDVFRSNISNSTSTSSNEAGIILAITLPAVVLLTIFIAVYVAYQVSQGGTQAINL